MKPHTRRDWSERILAVLVHIQRNLTEPLSLEELASLASFSPFHFHRVFRGMVGESVHQHIRRLRLERAAGELKTSDRAVTEIAFDAGYEAHESFSRAFRKAFGCSPSTFRASSSMAARAASPARVHFQPDGAQLGFDPLRYEESEMKVEIRQLEPMRVAFLRHTGPYDQVGGTWERLIDWSGAECLFGPDTRYFGLCYDDPEITSPEHLRYDACVSVDESVQPAGEIGVQRLPGGKYAVTLHEGPYNRLGETYAALFGRWFVDQPWQPGPAPCLEFYLNDPDSTEADELLTEIWVALSAEAKL